MCLQGECNKPATKDEFRAQSSDERRNTLLSCICRPALRQEAYVVERLMTKRPASRV